MKKVFLLAIAAAFTFTACKDNKAEATTDAAATEMNVGHEDHTGHDHGTEATAPANETPAATNAPASTNTQGVKLNPPHGEPGHRCEIPVGQPLDGSGTPAKSAPTTQPQTQPANNGGGFLGGGNAQAQPSQAAPQAAPTQQTAPGMKGKPNPAHGQPGHRCDVQVGQPLP